MTERDIYRVVDLLELVLSSLGLNSEPIETKRTEILAMLITQPGKFICDGCKRFYFIENKFECISCGIKGCVCCMYPLFYHDGFNFPHCNCPQCNRQLSMTELKQIENQYKRTFVNN